MPSTEPGSRMPHRWLADGRSTLDAVGEWFTLFTADHREADGPWPIRVVADPEAREPLLVRPDGHIADPAVFIRR